MDVRPEIRVTVAGSDASGARIPVDDGARVLLTATPTELDTSDLVWLRNGSRIPDAQLAHGGRTLAVDAFEGADAGTYTVRVGGVTSRAVFLVARGPDGASPQRNGSQPARADGRDGQTSTAIELTPAVYDPTFARRSGIVALVAASLVSLASLALLWVGAFQYEGSFSERAGLILPVLSAWIGSLAVIGGVWMGAIETRGRLWLRITGGRAKATAEDAFAGADAIARQMPEFVRTLSVTRATVVVLFVGALVLGTSVMASCKVLSDTPSGTSTTPTTTTPPKTTTTKR